MHDLGLGPDAGPPWAPGTTRGTAMRLPTASSSRRSQPSTVRNGWLALAVTWRPDASRSSKTSLTPVGKAWVIVAGTMRRSVSSDHTGMSRSPLAASSPIVTSAPVSARRTRGVAGEAARLRAGRPASGACRRGARAGGRAGTGRRPGDSSSRARILRPAADLGHLDLAVLGVAPAGHELEVVDDDHAEVADLALAAGGPWPGSP